MTTWTPWLGGECPVAGETHVVVKFRNGCTNAALSARNWNWQHFGGAANGHDIIAYHVVEPERPPPPMDNLEAIKARCEAATAYDAGYLSDHGGGDVGWWQDYIRAELERSHDHYATEITRLMTDRASAREALAPFARAIDIAEACMEDVGAPVELLRDEAPIDPVNPCGDTPILCTYGDLRKARAVLVKAGTPAAVATDAGKGE